MHPTYINNSLIFFYYILHPIGLFGNKLKIKYLYNQKINNPDEILITKNKSK
jgi:hypothetical protein